MSRVLCYAIVAGVGFCAALGGNTAEAGSRFSFSLGFWGPPPIYIGPRCCDAYYPPPVVYRRIYVTEPPEVPVYVAPQAVPVYVAPPATAVTTSKRSHRGDPVLAKIGQLHSTESDTREDAARWLGHVRDPRAVRPLVEVLAHDPDHDVREEAAKSLGSIGTADSERALQTASQSDPSSDVRRAASKALGRMAKESNSQIRR